jgi:glycerate 2-kinase
MIIRDRDQLTSKGNIEGRRITLGIIESALREVNSFNLIKKLVRVDSDGCLSVGSFKYNLREIEDVFVVGGGKQVSYVASALEEVLGRRIREGVVVEKKGWGCKTNLIKVVEGGHPLPDSGSVEGANEIVKTTMKAGKADLIIVCVTGGCTSLTMLPPENITLEDLRAVSQLMLESGAPIEDLNTVRKHLSKVGGGKLAVFGHAAQLLSLIAIDEVAGVPWGPSVADTTSFADAKRVLVRHGLWEKIPNSVRLYLEKAEAAEETPKANDFERMGVNVRHVAFADNRTLCHAAERKAGELGLQASTISTSIEGEARDVGVVLASIAKEIEKNREPFKPPCVLIAGGETTVTIRSSHGEGGRNQELVLAAASKIAGSERITFASIGTDGTDGPTDIAGAICDGNTIDRAKQAGVDTTQALQEHDSSSVFKKLGDAIYTNDTGTNLMDLVVIYVCNAKDAGNVSKS